MVFVGRPFLYGAAIAGEAGARYVAELLRAEVRRDLALMGVASAGALGADAVQRVGI